MQRVAPAVADWAEQSGLEHNLGEGEIMLLGGQAYFISNPLNITNLPRIPNTQIYKNLGLGVTRALDWKAHVEHSLRKVDFLSGFLHVLPTIPYHRYALKYH